MQSQSFRPRKAILLAFFLTSYLACSDFSKEEAVKGLEATDVVSYWSVRGKFEENNYIRPIVRFRIHNGGSRPVDFVQTMAVFRRASAPQESWGSAFEYSLSGDPIAPGEPSRVITLRSDSYYFSTDEPESMFENEKWEQVTVEVFLKVGPSSWKPAAKLEVPRQLGAPGVEKFLAPSDEG